MGWPAGHINASFHENEGGWHVGATKWLGAGDYHDGLSTKSLIALIKNPKTECTSVDLWVRSRQVGKMMKPSDAIRALASFPAGVERSVVRVRTALETWQPK